MVNATGFHQSQHHELNSLHQFLAAKTIKIEVTDSSSKNHSQKPMKHQQYSNERIVKG